MKTEKKNCCFCFNIASEGNIINSDILDRLKFLIGNVNTSALENSAVCDGCLNKIVESCDYKTNSSEMLMEAKQKVDSEKPIMCQKCKKVCEQGDTFSLVNCVTQIDWSDFVNYLFVDQDTQSLESLQLCDSCRISVSNIQDFLKLIYIYDQSKMKCDIDYFDDIKATENKNLVEDKIEIKNELENFVVDDKTVVENLIEGNKTEMDDSDYINYADFKCINEEVAMKLEYDDDDDNQSTDQCEKVDVERERTSSGGLNKNIFSNKEEELGVNFQGCQNKLRYNLKVPNNIRDYKCIYCSKKFAKKYCLDNHLLRIHKSTDGVTSTIHVCDKCSYLTTKKCDMSFHRNNKHGIEIELQKYKCQNCTYETFYKYKLIRHLKIHYNIQDFKCILCLKGFNTKIDLDNHLLIVHKDRDNVTSKIHDCDKCHYASTKKK